MKNMFSIVCLLLLFFSCSNEKGSYPSNIKGKWVALESEKSWILFDSVDAIINIHYDDQFARDTDQYFYIQANGYGMIPIENEDLELGIIEIQMSETEPKMIAKGEDKNIEGLFTYHMVKKQ